MSAPAQPPARYRIRIRGHLDPAWSAWSTSGPASSVVPSSTWVTVRLSNQADQAALFGLLARLRDLGATLLLVEAV